MYPVYHYKLPNKVDGAEGESDITDLWRQEFSSRFNCIEDSVCNEHLAGGTWPSEPVSVEEVALLGCRLASNKAKGLDDIPAEVFKFASYKLCRLMALLFSLMFKYRYIPKELMKVVLIPIIKNKTLNPGISANYRPIAIPTSASKLLELIISERTNPYLETTNSQFGFKSHHGTDMAIFSFKETTKHYVKSGTPVFMCFLDASKAFDRLNHSKLFTILISRGVPRYIVQLLSYWYGTQEYVVK